jgi:hypothetical protein
MPSPSEWQQSLQNANFPVSLDTDFDVDSFSGFLPCEFRGSPSGFEYFADSLGEVEREEVGAPEETDFQITLATHSDYKEFATSLLAAAALCQASNGVLVDPQSGHEVKAEAVLDWARASLAQLEPLLK